MTKEAPYEFEENRSISSATMRSELGLAHYATAQNCWDAMVEKFKLSEYDDSVKRMIMGIRLTMIVADYSDAYPYTFAEGVSIETVTKLKESYSYLSGVDTEVDSTREYTSATLAPHILGNMGLIYAEEWADLKDKGYSFDDYIGRAQGPFGLYQNRKGFLRKDTVEQCFDRAFGRKLGGAHHRQKTSGNGAAVPCQYD